MRRAALVATLSLAAAGCAAVQPVPAPPAARGAPCPDPDLSLRRVGAAEPLAGLVPAEHKQRGTLRLILIDTVEGACGASVEAWSMSQILLADGQRLQRDGEDGPLRPATLGSPFTNLVAADAPHPQVKGAEFLMGDLVGYIGPNRPGRYLGLWRDRRGWLVAAYARQRDGGWAPVVPLLRSATPLRSVTYFPAVDTPSGRLGLVQEHAQGVRLIGLDWSHPDAFR